ncbi:hypothetical protein E4U09_005091 [Claviceps aff. purpurea]|uniref:Uncharacterized protein n=1 Tax=Claviceps aff. purpurea TaxID=1967640 RepID=A0A9P7QNQ5_9HYPO|nr:hypothetical protein E4U09_005091 [Claviceps aff. purpurea]
MPNFQPSLNLKSFKTTPSGIEYSETPSYRSDSPSAKCRRSVPSMKGLMPLALSSPFSNSESSSQSVTIDDGVVPCNDCLPELLARDLERSSDIFASKDMTAGTPNTVSKPEEKIRTRVSKVSYSPYFAASARVQVLGAIEERDSMISFMDQQEPELVVDQHSDSASTTSHDSSEEAEPPSFRHRGSVVTSATSVGSTPYNKTRVSSLPERSCACSWIDVDSDRDEDQEILDDCHFDSLSPRPPTPAAGSEARMPPVAPVPRTDMASIRSRSSCMFRPRSHSVNEDLSNPTVRRYSMGPPVRLPQRSSSINTLLPRTSMSCAESSLPQSFGTRTPGRSKKPKRIQPLAIDTACNDGFVPTTCVREAVLKPGLMRDLSPMDDGYTQSDNEALWSPTRKRAPKENYVFVRPPSPPQRLHSVQSWLNSSLQPFPWSPHGDDNAKLVPLPPDAVENLRISVALFPETMLLTSSLTVETIRSFSKKVRRPSLDSSSIVLGEGLLPESPRRSLWRKVIPHRRGSQFSDPRTLSAPPSPRHPGSSAPTSPASTDALKPWMPLKNVFGCCSDYICDALYAHIVAYNYVSAFLSKNPVPLSARGRSERLNLRESPSQDDIPAKAAYLLGLSASGDGAATMGRFPHRLGSLPGDRIMEGILTHRDTVLIAQDNTLRAIQSGLLRCVSRLLNTAKHMAENDTTEDGVIEVESGDADMLFLRSLCEIVRMAEDSM